MAENNNVAVVEEAKTRKSPELKNKVVEFAITKVMRLADLVDAGYQRKEVEHLFAAMENDGLGVYELGHLGRGCSAKFICGETFPESYTITVQVRRLRQNYTGKPAPIEAPAENSVIMPAQESWLANADAVVENDAAPVVVEDIKPAEIIDNQ